MSSLVSREVHLISRPEGLPVPENFALVQASVPAPEKGELLVKNIYMSVDPAMRPPMTLMCTANDTSQESPSI